MWDYDSALDNYTHTENKYRVEVEANKIMPAWKTFYLCDETDVVRKLISTDIYSALSEAELLIERLENEHLGI